MQSGCNFGTFMSIRFRKRFGQHILAKDAILDRIVKASRLRPGERVLEIGPGTGNLTERMLDAGARVSAIELDTRMVEHLQGRFGNHQGFALRWGDALSAPLPAFDVCVANVPYQISSPLLYRLLSGDYAFRHAVLMFQEEFASRLYAPQGSKRYSRLSVSSQLLAVTDPLFAVPRDAFLPPPKVDSRMVKVRPRYPFPPYRQMQELHALLRLCFSRPNRTLRAIFRQASNLHSYCGASNASKRDAGDGGRQPRERPSPDGASRVVIGAWEQPESLPTGTPAGADGEADDLPSHLAPLLQDELLATASHVCDAGPEAAVAVLEKGGWAKKRAAGMKPLAFARLLAAFHGAGQCFAHPAAEQEPLHLAPE